MNKRLGLTGENQNFWEVNLLRSQSVYICETGFDFITKEVWIWMNLKSAWIL